MKAYELRNFTEVASELFISQPTVSVQLKKLEDDLNINLFIRQGPKQVIPTDEADFLYSQLLTLSDEWTYMLEQLQNIQAKKEVCIMACSNTCATNFIPKIFVELQQQFPTLIFEIQQVNSDEVIGMLERHEAHIGFIEKPLIHETFERFAIYEDELVLAGDDEANTWLMRESESGIYYYNQRYLEEKNIDLPILKVNSNAVIVAMLKEGIGKTIISKQSLTDDIPWHEESRYIRNFYCVVRKHPTTSEINHLNDYIEKQYKLK